MASWALWQSHFQSSFPPPKPEQVAFSIFHIARPFPWRLCAHCFLFCSPFPTPSSRRGTPAGDQTKYHLPQEALLWPCTPKSRFT